MVDVKKMTPAMTQSESEEQQVSASELMADWEGKGRVEKARTEEDAAASEYWVLE